MGRPSALLVLAIAIAIGLAAELLLDGAALGINVPVLVLLLLIGAWSVRERTVEVDVADAWLPVAAVLLAGLVAIRADPVLAALDSAGALILASLTAVALSGRPVTRGASGQAGRSFRWVADNLAGGTAVALRRARPAGPRGSRLLPDWAAPLARGLLLGLPLVVIFAVLFASADPIFGRGVDDLLQFRIDLADLPGRALFTLAVAWFAGGLLAMAARGAEAPTPGGAADARAADEVPVPGGAADMAEGLTHTWGRADRSPSTVAGRIGLLEAVVVLVVVDVVVGLFVGLQMAYLFGGLDTLAAAGLTYSAYARRGYVELVLAATLAIAVIAGLDLTVTRRGIAYVVAAVGLAGLTFVVLASSALRLALYLGAYGWTELRLWVVTSIVALSLLLTLAVVFVLVDRVRWLGRGVVLLALASLLGLGWIAPPAFVAARNVERAIDPSLVPPDGRTGLDALYLAALPDDAVPVLVDALRRLPADDAGRVRALLLRRREQLQADATLQGPGAWNLGRLRAKVALEGLR